jgi:hypothetical protein
MQLLLELHGASLERPFEKIQTRRAQARESLSGILPRD